MMLDSVSQNRQMFFRITACWAVIAVIRICAANDNLDSVEGVGTDLFRVERNFIFQSVGHVQPGMHRVAKSQRADGTWTDVDYSGIAARHLYRMSGMAVAWQASHSEDLAIAVHRALGWWLANRQVKSYGWWWDVIGFPQEIGLTAVCFKSDLSDVERKAVVAILKRSLRRMPKMTGQNRVWLARIGMMCAFLDCDEKLLSDCVDVMADEIVFSSPEGIQRDWSYHQHGNQPQFGNYGLAFVKDMSFLVPTFAGSRFAFSSEKLDMLNNLLCQGFAWTYWKGRMDVSCVQRQFFPDAMTKKGTQLLASVERLARCDEKFARTSFAFREGHGPLGFKTFSNSAMSFYRQPGWMASHKGGTRSILGAETCVGGENALGQHLQDGMLCVSVTGEEYDNIFPFWNWRKLPGITSYPDLPPASHNDNGRWRGPNRLEEYRGERTAEGGVVTFGVSREDIEYRQKIVFSPKGVFVETTDISSTNAARVVTCVEAANAADNACVLSQTETETRLLNGLVEYLIMAPRKSVEVFIGERSGDYCTFMREMPSTIRSGRIFEVVVNHGVAPKSASCRYYVVPRGGGVDCCNGSRIEGVKKQ